MNTYIVVLAVSPYDLEDAVNEKIKEGYMPIGGATTARMGYVTFMQAMILGTSST